MRLFNIVTAVLILVGLVITALALTSIDTQRRAVETQVQQMLQDTQAQKTANASTTATLPSATPPAARLLGGMSEAESYATRFYALPQAARQATTTAVYATIYAKATLESSE